MSLLTTAVIALAAPPADIDPTTGRGEEWGKAAPVGLLIILLMCVAMFFLLRSMNRNMRKVPASFDEPQGDEQVAIEQQSGVDGNPDTPVGRTQVADTGEADQSAEVVGHEPVERR